jgi:integrase
MRHTAITALVKTGVALPTIQRISGHKTLAMMLRYAHVHGEHIDKPFAPSDVQIQSPRGTECPAPLHRHHTRP